MPNTPPLPLEFVATRDPKRPKAPTATSSPMPSHLLEIKCELLDADDVCRFCHANNPLGMQSLPWPKWPGAEVSHLFRAVTGDVLPNGAGFAESWCLECLDELRRAASLIEKFRQSGEYWRKFMNNQSATSKIQTSLSTTNNNSPCIKNDIPLGDDDVAQQSIGDDAAQQSIDDDDAQPSIGDDLDEFIVYDDNTDGEEDEYSEAQYFGDDHSYNVQLTKTTSQKPKFITNPPTNVTRSMTTSSYAGGNTIARNVIAAPPRTPKNAPIATIEPPTPTFVCDHCDVVTESEAALADHRRLEHPPTVDTNNDAGDDDVVVVPLSSSEPLRFVMTPGSRINSCMLYTLDEKNIYRRKYTHPSYDRYICNVRSCRVRVNLSAADGKCYRVGRHARHNHGNQEAIYLRNQFENALRRQDYQAHEEKVAAAAAASAAAAAAADASQSDMGNDDDGNGVVEMLDEANEEAVATNTDGVEPPKRSMKRKRGQAPCICQICGHRASSGRLMLDHFRKQHGDQQKFLCDQCPKELHSERALRAHITNNHAATSASDSSTPKGVGDNIEYTIGPGKTLNSSLLYAIQEKQLYRKKSSHDSHDRYICTARTKPPCSVAINVARPSGIARYVDFKRKHSHGDREEQFLRNQFVSAVKIDVLKSCGDSLVRPKDVFAKRLAMDSVGGSLAEYKRISRTLNRYKANDTIWFHCGQCEYKFRSEKSLKTHLEAVHQK